MIRQIRWLVVSRGVPAGVLFAVAFAFALPESAMAYTVPAGFNVLVPTAGGVTVYKKVVPGGAPDYVTVVNMTQGTFTHFNGAVDLKKGDNRGAAVTKSPFGDFVTTARGKETNTKKLVAVMNGTFFFTDDQPARISFGLKSNNQIISLGSDLNNYAGHYRTLPFKPDRANVLVHGDATFNDPSIPNVIGGLDPTANVAGKANQYVARTFIGLRNDDRDSTGSFETVFIYSSQLGKPAEITKILTDFGADPTKIIQLDGGASGALRVVGAKPTDPPRVNYSGRPIPHVIAVYAGK